MIGGTEVDMKFFESIMDLEDLIYPKTIGVWIQLSLRGDKAPLKRADPDHDGSDTDSEHTPTSTEGISDLT